MTIRSLPPSNSGLTPNYTFQAGIDRVGVPTMVTVIVSSNLTMATSLCQSERCDIPCLVTDLW